MNHDSISTGFFDVHLKAASRLARAAGKILLSFAGKQLTVEHKGTIDLVTDADKASEAYLVGELRSLFPGYAVMTEESGSYPGTEPWTWVIDPLDGTTNFAHGFPFYCVSIALARGEEPLLGAVYDPVRDELFSAVKGEGAFLNGRRLEVSEVSRLDDSLLATGFPYDIRTAAETNLDYFAHLALRAQAVRRAGSAALDLCYVAAGRFEGYWELKLKPWDMAVGNLAVIEAGGIVTDIDGRAPHLSQRSVIAGNNPIHAAMLAAIAEVKSNRSRPLT